MAIRDYIGLRGGKITGSLPLKEVTHRLQGDVAEMNKRVTVLFGISLVLTVAMLGIASGGERTQAGEVEKNIRITISDEAGSVDGEEFAWSDEEEGDVKVIMKGEDYAFIGINMEDLTEKIRKELGYKKEAGVLVTGIVEESAAEKHGLEKDDIIYMFAGEKVLGSEHLAGLVKEKKPGEKVKIVYYRDGKKKEMDLELGEREFKIAKMDYKYYGDVAKQYSKLAKEAGKHAFITGEAFFMQKGRLGLKLMDLDGDLASYFDVEPGEGVLVLEVIEDSAAEEAGVKAGDVVVMVGDEKVSDAEEILENIYELDAEDEVTLIVVRKGQKKEIMVAVDEDQHIFRIHPGKEMIKAIEIPQIPPYEMLKMEKFEKQALEKEIQSLREELKMLEKRLEKMEKK